MARYYSGHGSDLGNVFALGCDNFESLGLDVLCRPEQLAMTKGEFVALMPKERDRAKRVDYLVACTFVSDSSPRRSEFASNCNLIALDIDDSVAAGYLLELGWEGLRDFGHIVWHTASSTPEKPRLRVLVHAESIPISQYPAAVRTVGEMLGLPDVTRESLVSVQPMFLPTIFKDSGAGEPIISSNFSGDPFRVIDIISGSETSIILDSGESDDKVGDITYLKLPMERVTIDDAAGALAVLDPDCSMQDWIEVGAGLKHQFNNTEAYELWDSWSAKGRKYVSAEETAYRWGTLRANPSDRAPVTIRSVFKKAQLRGWSNPTLIKREYTQVLEWIRNPQRSTEELFDQGTQRIAKASATIGQLERKTLMIVLRDTLDRRNIPLPLPDIRKEIQRLELESAKTTGVPAWTKGLCFITSLNQFYRHTTDRRFSPEVVDLMYSTPSIGEDKPLRPRDYLMQIVGVQQVENLRYEPAQGDKRFFSEDNKPYCNTYRATYPKPEPSKAAAAGEIFWAHICNLIIEPEWRQMLVDFLAYHVQHPGKKVRWAVLLQSVQGAGKTFLAVAMTAVLGRRNVRKLSASDVLDGVHNDWAYGQQLVILEEVRIVGANRYGIMDKLKPCISDDEISIHRKFEHHQTVQNITNYLMFTNHHDSLAIHDDDRRYFVLSSPLQTPEDIAAIGGAEYFKKLFDMVRDNAAGLRAWFEQWKIGAAFKPEGRAPMTAYLHDLVANAATPLAAAVNDAIAEESHPLIRLDIISLGVLRDALDTSRLPPFSDQALASVLREQGWIKFGRVMIAGEKHQLWSKGKRRKIREAAEMRLRFL